MQARASHPPNCFGYHSDLANLNGRRPDLEFQVRSCYLDLSTWYLEQQSELVSVDEDLKQVAVHAAQRQQKQRSDMLE